MNTHIRSLLLIVICCIPGLAWAQAQHSVSGIVKDSASRPIELATIALHSLPDSAVVKTTLSDSVGAFVLDGLKDGQYFPEVYAMDHTVYKGAAITLTGSSVQLPAITLVRSGSVLQEVAVTARKALVVHKADRTVVNVDALISAAGGTAMDVLEKSPGVQVDQDGNVSLRGRQGVTIYIDDRPTYLSGADLASYLKSLPSSALDQVELMTNPPANYDAAGNAGIINIKLKKNNVKGFNGSVNVSVNQGVMTRSNNSVNLNYRNNKVSTYLNISYGLDDGFTDLDLYRTYRNADGTPASYFEQNTYFRRKGNNGNIVAGADYYHSDKGTLGMVVTAMGHTADHVNRNTSYLLDTMRRPDSMIVARNKELISFSNLGFNLNYRRKLKKDAKLTADADYVIYNTYTDQTNHNMGYSASGILRTEDTLRGQIPCNINIYSFKADYTRPNTLSFTFSAGVKTSITETDNKADYTLFNTSGAFADYDKSNHFLYRENINAAYINLAREIGRLSVQAGLRLEQTATKGHQLGNALKPDSSFTRNYNSLFPTVYFSYKFDSQATHQLDLNYGRRIDRPYYQDLNPFVSPMDKFTYYTGNPFLKPSFNQSISLSHTYKGKLSTILTYSRSKDDVNETIRMQDGIYYSMSGNIGTKTNITLGVDGDLDAAKWLNIHGYTEVGNITSKSEFYTGTLSTSGTYWFIMGNLRFTPGKDWTLEASGNYRSRIYDAQFIIQDLWHANIAIQKKLTPKATLKLAFNDVFYSHKVLGTITNLVQADAGWVNRGDSRNVSIAFGYRFGKKVAGQEKYEARGAETEKNRVKE